MSKKTTLQQLAGRMSSSFLCRKGRRLWEANAKQWNLPLSKWEKLLCGGYIILNDYAQGLFPPRFEDQAIAYQNEIEYNASLPDYSLAEVQKAHAIKPFWGAADSKKYLDEFNRLYAVLQEHGIKEGQRLLELGCGSGWTAEFLALAGYSILGTTIADHDIALANQKVASLKCKELYPQLTFNLQFQACAMEEVDAIPGCLNAFDAAYVYEALHHAFDWRKALQATARTLKSGGWLLIANEPNRLHAWISYRVAKLAKTHEIGFSKTELLHELKAIGFSDVRVLAPRIDNWVAVHWILARKK